MDRTTILVCLALGFSAFALTWATVRHFTGLAEEYGLALAIGIAVGILVAVGYAALEWQRFGFRRRRKHP